MQIKEFILDLSATLTRLISKISKPEPSITDQIVDDILANLKDGDAVCTRTDYELSNFFEKIFFKSFYGHVAIYIKGHFYEAVTKDGVRKVSVNRLCLTKDHLGHCRLPGPDWTNEQISIMHQFLEDQLNEGYDYSFNYGTTEKWYCSKLVYFAWSVASPETYEAISAKKILGEKRIMPQDIWNSTKQIKQYGE